MRLTLVRHATLLLELEGRRVLVEPMLDDAGAREPVEDSPKPRRNPLVPLPFPAEEVVRGLDAVVVTHMHQDHFDETGARLVPRDVPVFCQPEDEERLRASASTRAPSRTSSTGTACVSREQAGATAPTRRSPGRSRR